MNRSVSLKKVLIIMCVAMTSGLVLYYLAFHQIKSKNKHIAELTHTLEEENKKQSYISSQKTAVESADPILSDVTSSILPIDGDINFIEKIESLASNQKLEIIIDSLSLDNDPKLDKVNLTTLNVVMRVKGSWSGIYTFNKEVESLKEQIQVKSFSLAGPDKESDTKNKVWQAKFEIRVLKHK